MAAIRDALIEAGRNEVDPEKRKEIYGQFQRAVVADAPDIFGVLENRRLAMRDNVLPPTINYENPDPLCDLDYIPNEAREKECNIALTNSFGFGGQNISLVVANCD